MVLFFDPGPSTGVALVDGDEVVHTWVIRSDEEVKDLAESLAEHYPDVRVGIEAPPQWGGNFRPVTQTIEEILRTVFPNAEWISPGQWKNTPSARTKVPPSLTQHEKDAVRAARFLQRSSA